MTQVDPAKREWLDRKTWELTGFGQWVRLAVDTQGYIELRVQTARGQDLLVLDTSGGKVLVKLYDPLRPGVPPLLQKPRG